MYTGNAWALPCLILCLHLLSTLRRKLTHIFCTSLKPPMMILLQWYWKLCIQKVPAFYGRNSLAAQRFLSLETLKCSWMFAWEEWCSIRVKDEFIAFPHQQELHLDVLLKYQDQHRALLGPLKISNFLKQSFMQFCRYVLIAHCLVYLTEYIPQTYRWFIGSHYGPCRLLVLTKLRLLEHSTWWLSHNYFCWWLLRAL